MAAYWVFKSEPSKYPWEQLVTDGQTHWDGVRNHQAANNLKAMRLGDRGFFYHSNIGLQMVGVVEVTREYHPDPSDPTARFGMVAVRPLLPLTTPVTLKQIKADPLLSGMALVRQSRLSVCPVTDDEWQALCRLGGLTA
jgi:predicted RNA-binding protein with PUA-like domain